MASLASELAELDRIVHEPARLALLTALAASTEADFLFLCRLTGLTKGNLSAHLAKLEAAGLIDVRKEFVRKKPRTILTITSAGKDAIEVHWHHLDQLRKVKP
jgi:DNA-binding transcriptional ArsR family regulator